MIQDGNMKLTSWQFHDFCHECSINLKNVCTIIEGMWSLLVSCEFIWPLEVLIKPLLKIS